MRFTVTVDCVGSGNSRICKPFGSVYSVMPSTLRTFVAFGIAAATVFVGSTPAVSTSGSIATEVVGGAGTVVAGFAPPQAASRQRTTKRKRMTTAYHARGR